jgi:cellulose synthase/poly-beta-1,6-N-acetylglucosamine synthase-like glycosyltransferase
MYNSNEKFKKEMTVFPSYSFLPMHYTGIEYKGHGKIYAYQEWGSTKKNYEQMNKLTLPQQFTPPNVYNSVTILVSSYNKNNMCIKKCLESIKRQEGWFNIELHWVNNDSDEINTNVLKSLLNNFENTTRFCKVVYVDNEYCESINNKLTTNNKLCGNETIIKLNLDDIMMSTNKVKGIIDCCLNEKQKCTIQIICGS